MFHSLSLLFCENKILPLSSSSGKRKNRRSQDKSQNRKCSVLCAPNFFLPEAWPDIPSDYCSADACRRRQSETAATLVWIGPAPGRSRRQSRCLRPIVFCLLFGVNLMVLAGGRAPRYAPEYTLPLAASTSSARRSLHFLIERRRGIDLGRRPGLRQLQKQQPRTDWKMDLQTCGVGRESRKRPALVAGKNQTGNINKTNNA